jgi:hypothetical protein
LVPIGGRRLDSVKESRSSDDGQTWPTTFSIDEWNLYPVSRFGQAVKDGPTSEEYQEKRPTLPPLHRETSYVSSKKSEGCIRMWKRWDVVGSHGWEVMNAPLPPCLGIFGEYLQRMGWMREGPGLTTRPDRKLDQAAKDYSPDRV